MCLMRDGGCQSKVPLRHSTDVTALPLKSHATIARSSLDASDTLYFPIAVPDIMPLISCRSRLAPPSLVFYVACVLPTSMMNAKFDEVQWCHFRTYILHTFMMKILKTLTRSHKRFGALFFVPASRPSLPSDLSLGVPFIFVQ